MKRELPITHRCVAAALATLLAAPGFASSHMDAPLITRDPSANTTDVYAFVQKENDVKTLVTALGVYPHEEPGIGPNKYNFDDNVLYEIHVATGEDVAAGRATISYQFQFKTQFKTKATILQSYLGVVSNIADSAQNLLKLRSPGKDSQGGFNLHLMSLAIPVSELGGDQQVVGVYASTSRRQIRIISQAQNHDIGRWVQVARQGNPLFNEGLVAIQDKD